MIKVCLIRCFVLDIIACFFLQPAFVHVSGVE